MEAVSLRFRTLNNKEYKLNVQQNDTVSFLKEKLKPLIGAELTSSLRLINDGAVLDDCQTITSANLSPNTPVVILVSRKKSGSLAENDAKEQQNDAKEQNEAKNQSRDSDAKAQPRDGDAKDQFHDSNPSDPLEAEHPAAPSSAPTSTPASARPSAPPSPSLGPQPAVQLSPEAMAAVAAKVRETMYRAFFDTIRSRLSADPPDFEWVVRLFQEIRDRLCALTPNRRDIHADIHEHMDVQFFDQMLRSGVYRSSEMLGLVHYVFDKIIALEAPARNDSSRRLLQEVEGMLVSETVVLAEVVPVFLRAVHYKLDQIDQDVAAFRMHLRRQQQQQQPQQQPPQQNDSNGKSL